MANPKLTVTTPEGTFTRQTARTYTHLVITRGYRAELLEAKRLQEIPYFRKLARNYRKGLDGYGTPARTPQDQLNTWADEYDQRAADLEAKGPITQDHDRGWGLAGWCGRLDLAVKLADQEAKTYRQVKIYRVADGQLVGSR